MVKKKPSPITSDYSKVAGYNVMTQKSIICLYTISQNVGFEMKTIQHLHWHPANEILRYKSNKICKKFT